MCSRLWELFWEAPELGGNRSPTLDPEAWPWPQGHHTLFLITGATPTFGSLVKDPTGPYNATAHTLSIVSTYGANPSRRHSQVESTRRLKRRQGKLPPEKAERPGGPRFHCMTLTARRPTPTTSSATHAAAKMRRPVSRNWNPQRPDAAQKQRGAGVLGVQTSSHGVQHRAMGYKHRAIVAYCSWRFINAPQQQSQEWEFIDFKRLDQPWIHKSPIPRRFKPNVPTNACGASLPWPDRHLSTFPGGLQAVTRHSNLALPPTHRIQNQAGRHHITQNGIGWVADHHLLG